MNEIQNAANEIDKILINLTVEQRKTVIYFILNGFDINFELIPRTLNFQKLS